MDTYITDLIVQIDSYRKNHADKINRSVEEYKMLFQEHFEKDKDQNAFLIKWQEVIDNFNTYLKKERETRSLLSQVELAYLLGVSPFTVSSWESQGKRNAEKNIDATSTEYVSSSREKRTNFNKTLWQVGRRLPSLEQAYVLSHVTEVGLNYYFLDPSFDNRIKAHNRTSYLLSLMENDTVSNKESFFAQVSPTIEAYLKEESQLIKAQENILSSSDVFYIVEPKGLDAYSVDTINALQEDYITTITCYILKLFSNDALTAVYKKIAADKLHFYFKNAFKILLSENNVEPFSGIEYKTNIQRLFLYLEKIGCDKEYSTDDFSYINEYFKSCTTFLQACDIIHFEAKQRTTYLDNLINRYTDLKNRYGSKSNSAPNYGKREFLHKLGIEFTEDNLEERYEKAVELLSPIAKSLSFSKKD